MPRRYSLAIISLLIIFGISHEIRAELILAEGSNISLLSCSKIYDRFYLLYGKWNDNAQEVFLKEYTLAWRQIQERKLGINGVSAHLAHFNDRFYIAYTSFEKEGNARIAEFDSEWNFLGDILATDTPYDGEVAYQLIPLGNDSLYLFYARNWQNDCGLKMLKFNRYLEPVKEVTLIRGDIDFHARQASDFSVVFARDEFCIAYKKYSHPELNNNEVSGNRNQEEVGQQEERISMDIFVNEYNFSGDLIKERLIDEREKLSPSLFFDNERFYLAYEGERIIYICQYDTNWDLVKKTKIITQESGAPREKAIIVSGDRCYLVNISQRDQRNRIFLKEINFALEKDEIRLQ